MAVLARLVVVGSGRERGGKAREEEDEGKEDEYAQGRVEKDVECIQTAGVVLLVPCNEVWGVSTAGSGWDVLERPTFTACTNACPTSCLPTSPVQIVQGRRGVSRERLYTREDKTTPPMRAWTMSAKPPRRAHAAESTGTTGGTRRSVAFAGMARDRAWSELSEIRSSLRLMSWFNAPSQPPQPPPRQQPPYAALPAQPRPSPSRPRPPTASYNDQYEKPRPTPSQPQQHRGNPGSYAVVGGNVLTTDHALTNCLIVNDRDWHGVKYVLVKHQYVLTTKYVQLPSTPLTAPEPTPASPRAASARPSSCASGPSSPRRATWSTCRRSTPPALGATSISPRSTSRCATRLRCPACD